MRGAFEILDGLIPLGFQFLVGDAGHDPRARAVAAVGSAAIGDEEKDAVGITMNKSRDRHVGILSTGIGHFRRISQGFFDPRDDLAPDGAIRIRGVDEIEKVGRNGRGQLGSREENPGALFFGEGQVFLNVGEGGDAVLELPLGGVPVFSRYVLVGPVTRSRRSEGEFAQIGEIVRYIQERSKISVWRGNSEGGEAVRTR